MLFERLFLFGFNLRFRLRDGRLEEGDRVDDLLHALDPSERIASSGISVDIRIAPRRVKISHGDNFIGRNKHDYIASGVRPFPNSEDPHFHAARKQAHLVSKNQPIDCRRSVEFPPGREDRTSACSLLVSSTAPRSPK